MSGAPTEILVLCTGNAARSVMAGFMLEELLSARPTRVAVTTAGTHAVEGQPISIRTASAIASIPALSEAAAGDHRSRLLVDDHVERADLVVAMEADHVRFVRRRHPAAAARTATIRRLAAHLQPGPQPLGERVAALGLARVELCSTEDVADPAGHGQDVYDACARELWDLCRALVARL